MPGSPGAEPAVRTVADAGERELIARIRRRAPAAPAWVTVPIGDDAAVVEPLRHALVVLTTDALVEGVHFDRRLGSAADAGHRALAVNLSDLAAMGAEPRAALLSLMLPTALSLDEFDDLVDGFLTLAARHRVALVGGNVTRSPGPLVIDVTALGAAGRRRVLPRGGARPGDELFLSGSIGGAAAGLAWLRSQGRQPGDEPGEPEMRECVRRYRRPDARVRLGLLVGRTRAASACVDLSDGLSDAVRQLAQASGVSAVLDADAVPVDPGAQAWFTSQGRDPLQAALHGGDDYELLFAVPSRRRRQFLATARQARETSVTRVGVVEAGSGARLRSGTQESALSAGYEHFGSQGGTGAS